MSGKYLRKIDLAAARREQEIWNSMVNRGEIDGSNYMRTYYVVCGCGAPGCGFISGYRKSDGWHIDLEQEQIRYKSWLENHQIKDYK